MSVMRQAQAKGVELNCYVTGMAASMAFQILAFCDNKYALPYSMLLWHPVRATNIRSLTPDQSRTLARHLVELEKYLIDELRSNFDIEDEVFWHHYHEETLHLARMVAPNLKDLKLVDLAPERTDKTYRANSRGLFGRVKGDINYIHPAAEAVFWSTQ